MIGLSRTEHDGNPREGGFERRDYARSGETWGKWGNMSRIRQGRGRRKRMDTRDRHGKTGCNKQRGGDTEIGRKQQNEGRGPKRVQ